jgi:hypothetical protein
MASIVVVMSAQRNGACARDLSSGPVDGVFFDAGTNTPVAGAFVAARSTPQQKYSHTVCYHVALTTADESGKYHIPKWSDPNDHRDATDPQTITLAYRPGFLSADENGSGWNSIESREANL